MKGCWLLRDPIACGLRADFETGTFVAFQVAFGQFLAASLSTVSSITGSLDVLPLFERMTPILRTLPEEESGAAHPGAGPDRPR